MRRNAISLFVIAMVLMASVLSGVAKGISEAQSQNLKEHCDEVREKLKIVQKNDAKTRVFLGSKYETILNKYIVPLNVRLVENNLSSNGLINLQNSFAETRAVFNADYINYQQSLENLVTIDCRTEPDRFYNELSIVRKKRLTMEQDVLKMRNLLTQYVKSITELKGKM